MKGIILAGGLIYVIIIGLFVLINQQEILKS